MGLSMDWLMILKAILISIVEGITEFIPISSTGHMILVDEFLKLSDNQHFTTAFEVIIQLGAIFSVVVFFWNDIWPFTNDKVKQKNAWDLWLKVLVAVIPAAILGFLFNDIIEEKLFNSTIVAITLIVYGLAMILLERYYRGKSEFKYHTIASVPYLIAIAIGFFQCLAMVPGTSRSAATILGAMLLGLARGTAAEFSFILAIPTMAGATLLTLVKNGAGFSNMEWITIAIGFLVSFIVAYAVIKLFMGFIRKHDLSVFGYYRIALGLIVLLILWNR